jgi:deoxyribodipyrimidine photo-lyase
MLPSHSTVPSSRVRVLDDRPPRPDGGYVLYWMTATRRTTRSFALQRAAEWARSLRLPLVVVEGLRVGYRWAADRHHVFVLQGMADQLRACEAAGVHYLPHVERVAGEGRGLLRALASAAAVVVADDSPVFFLPRMLRAAAQQVETRFEAIDDFGLLPRHSTDRVFTTAHSFRGHLQKVLPEHLAAMPREDPLADVPKGQVTLPVEAQRGWSFATAAELARPQALAATLPIDHDVGPVARTGGAVAGQTRLAAFVREGIDRYGEGRNHPDDDAGSGLSPYLHYGHVGAHQALAALADRYDWSPGELGPPNRGARHGYWGLPEHVEGFIDELVTWREIGGNFATHRDDIASFESLPRWALATIEAHAEDPRPYLYTHAQLEGARTHDEVWNAAQRQLRREGIMHNYLRMLWGKLVYAWSPDGRHALQSLIELNNRWALDGRDPNSYSGIFWVFGRYDRAWGPERELFGKLRYMTTQSTRRKLRLREYLRRHGPETTLTLSGVDG